MRLTNAHLNALRAAYSTLGTCTIEGFEKLKALVGRFSVRDLEKLADSGIPFVDTAANSVLVDRGIRSEDARADHAADVILWNNSRAASA